MINFFRNSVEKRIFGVSAWWGNRLGVRPSFIRLFFIYAAFTNTITVIVYLIMVFILKVRNHFKYRKRKSVFDL